ncbi:protein spaetzle 5 isoform X1 [Cephus cinctus]|uniref:Protein spaetzle 5 isoform X1 n=1 Tax=Cephus cinctus TaxID=211228 RepID=A0AAJ7FUN5_CEPCN|nr:protein spaetzle 5 isoform X1 [Cephus cinctus]
MRQLLELILLVLLTGGQAEPCSEYGCPHRPHHEPFVPAPPGHTPRCAKPGQTFCETLDHYPQQLIRFLIDKWNFDYNRVLIDESRDDFNSYRTEPDYQEGYEYHRPEISQFYPQPLPFLPPHYPFGGQPASVYGPPPNTTHQPGYNYPVPPRTQANPFLQQPVPMGTSAAPQLPHLQQQPPRQHHLNPFLYPQSQTLESLGQDQAWWSNRYVRGSDGVVAPRSQRENPLLEFAKLKKDRTKRQANSQATALCPTNSQYIMPKAALNNKGNWMYVVNLQEQGNRYTQLVRSETCAGDTCNGLCSLPTGYTSRCQQQYVQKRLVALEGSGDRLYTDVFWFPHCCTCQVMLNN